MVMVGAHFFETVFVVALMFVTPLHAGDTVASVRDHMRTDSTSGLQRQPHIVIYLADDLGWNLVNFGGVQPHNQDVNTPTLAALAQEGIVLERHYT